MFTTDHGKTALNGYFKGKEAIDREIAELRKRERRKPMPHWVLHDLRRTARSILSRYTSPDIAERVIGHVIPGVRGVYDLYGYADEKRAALVSSPSTSWALSGSTSCRGPKTKPPHP